jgi:hypothetical protein
MLEHFSKNNIINSRKVRTTSDHGPKSKHHVRTVHDAYKDFLITAFYTCYFRAANLKRLGTFSRAMAVGQNLHTCILRVQVGVHTPQPEPEAICGQLAESSAATLKRG